MGASSAETRHRLWTGCKDGGGTHPHLLKVETVPPSSKQHLVLLSVCRAKCKL